MTPNVCAIFMDYFLFRRSKRNSEVVTYTIQIDSDIVNNSTSDATAIANDLNSKTEKVKLKVHHY